MNDRIAFATIGVVTLVVVSLVGVLMMTDAGARPSSFDATALPLINACLNTLSAGLLLAGWLFVRQRRIAAHVACMVGAFAVSALFLLSYVTYHFHAGSRPFTGQGWIRPVYFALLITHIVLAAAIVPLALTTIYHGWRGVSGRALLARHVRVARWTLPIWLYVSITGVLVYWLLYY